LAPDLPFEDPQTTYRQRVRPALEMLDGVDDRIVVVGHSLAAGYAPLVADAVPGSELVYLCPAPVGPFAQTEAPMRSSRDGFEFPPNGPDGTSTWEPEAAIAVMYVRLEPETARMVASCLRPGSSPADSYPLETQPDVPTTFVYAEHDEFFEPAWSTWAARDVAGLDPIALHTGHFPMIENPDVVAEVLNR
jgi:pimeloyl-ACP methyl ester carboxylesterase